MDLVPYFLPFTAFVVMLYFDINYQNPFVIVWIFYVLLPIGDFLLPVDHTNLKSNIVKAWEKD